MKSKKRLSEKEVEKNLNNVKATLAIEGLYVTEEEAEIARKILKAEISERDALKAMLEK